MFADASVHGAAQCEARADRLMVLRTGLARRQHLRGSMFRPRHSGPPFGTARHHRPWRACDGHRGDDQETESFGRCAQEVFGVRRSANGLRKEGPAFVSSPVGLVHTWVLAAGDGSVREFKERSRQLSPSQLSPIRGGLGELHIEVAEEALIAFGRRARVASCWPLLRRAKKSLRRGHGFADAGQS